LTDADKETYSRTINATIPNVAERSATFLPAVNSSPMRLSFAPGSFASRLRRFLCRWLYAGVASALLLGSTGAARGEAMLELFNVSWADLTQKMPEIAEAGYDSLWLPNPAKGGSGTYSIGYDQFDPFDLGDKNQCGTVATHWGTKAQLLQMVQTAHQFGIRVYFDNVMNHRAFAVPGFNSSTPTNYYPGLIPQDFHLQTVAGGYYANWPQIQNYCYQFEVQNQPLLGLVDLANEPGSINNNFGSSLGSTITKPKFIRQPNNPEYYMDTNGPSLGGNWHPFNGSNGQPVSEYVEDYLTRAAMWTLYTTKCDGFRLDAVKHVPSNFFGANTGSSTFTDDPSFSGYTGGVQAMYDAVHGYGNNVTGNGYVEADGNRNSLFDTEAPRNDAMLFGEHVSPVPDFQQYLAVGMRLCNQPLYNQMNTALSGNAGFQGMDGRDYAPGPDYCNGTPYACYSAAQSVMFPQTQDGGSCCPVHQELQDVYYFLHEGLPMIYSDGFNHSGPPDYFPIVSYANYLGQFSDNRMPEIVYLHNQLSRGGTWSRWSDQNVIAFERYDYRESTNPPDEDVVLFAMNDNFGDPGDISFDDGITRTSDGYYGSLPVSNSRNCGLCVGFPPGSVLVQLAGTGPGTNGYSRLLVHNATTSYQAAVNSANDPTPVNRLIYVNTTPPAGGGAIEFVIPSDGWVMYGYQWPEASRANPSTNAIIFRQGGAAVPHITVYRHDGTNGDPNFNPLYPFKMRGSMDPYGNVITGVNVSNLTYAIDIPVVTNGLFDILVRNDASSANTLVKLDGGMDINSQMGLGPTSGGVGPNGPDLRDNKPGYATDVFLGYEQTAFQFRNGPEKFAARNVASNNIVSLGAETCYYTVGGTNNIVYGSGYGASITNQTANWVWHDPTNSVTSLSTNPPTQRYPLNPASGQSVDVWVKVGYQFQINTCFIYYTTDGSNPEGAFGTGKGTTQVVPAFWVDHDSVTSNIDWWKGTIPGQPNGSQVRYKAALFYGGSVYQGQSIQPIFDTEPSGSKLYGLTQTAITNFNPLTAVVWLHNDLNTNNTTIGLQPGFHLVRARAFLPRTNQSSVYNTFLQTFYYDGALPAGVITSPVADGASISNGTYTVVVRTDSTVVGVDFNIQDSNPNNDDAVTGQQNGNGSTNGVPVFVSATPVSPDPTLSAQYPGYPQEFHFTYAAVPNSGAATIAVRLKEFATSIYPNRFTTLTRTANTVAPTQVVEISNPASDGTIITMNSSSTYPIQTCFTSTLDTNNINLFSIYINGLFQPRRDPATQAPFYFIGGTACATGMRMLTYNWGGAPVGTNVIQVIYTNSVILSDTRTVIVAPPLFISGLSDNNQLVVWDSAPGVNYVVLATTNLSEPFQPVSPIIQGSGPSTFYFDDSPPADQKFYRIQVGP
jgi:hypothetical protein